MKKIILIILLITVFTTSAYAVNVFDRILYKKVLLDANKMYVLVNRITGEVKYILLHTGKWALLTGVLKNQVQSMYNVQSTSK